MNCMMVSACIGLVSTAAATIGSLVLPRPVLKSVRLSYELRLGFFFIGLAPYYGRFYHSFPLPRLAH
jgi:hypothetical protein